MLALAAAPDPSKASAYGAPAQAACQQAGRATTGAFWLDAEVRDDGAAWRVRPLTNVDLRADRYGQAARPGEGHVHLYVNGVLLGPVLGSEPVALPRLERERYVVRLALASNDHRESAYQLCREVVLTIAAGAHQKH